MTQPRPGSGSPGPSPIRRLYDTAERGLAGRVEPMAQTGGFAKVLSIYVGVNRRVVRSVGAATGGLLHLVRIPTTSDVGKLHQHLATVDSHIAQLIRELEARPDASPPSLGEAGQPDDGER
jgi:hypothetical protein